MQRNPKIMRATITQNIGDVMQISFSEKNRKIEKLENNEIEISEKKASIAWEKKYTETTKNKIQKQWNHKRGSAKINVQQKGQIQKKQKKKKKKRYCNVKGRAPPTF